MVLLLENLRMSEEISQNCGNSVHIENDQAMPERLSASPGYSGFLLSMNFTALCIAWATALLATSSTSLAEILPPVSEANAASPPGIALIDLPGQATTSDTLAPNFLQSSTGPG
jgi:hypothetical protein